MFIRSFRKEDILLHLWKIKEHPKLFRDADQQNKIHCGPLYVADMFELRTNDAETWNFFHGGLGFTSMDPDNVRD